MFGTDSKNFIILSLLISILILKRFYEIKLDVEKET